MATTPTLWIKIEILYRSHWYHKKENSQRSQNETLIPVFLLLVLKNESLRKSASCPLQRLTQNMIVLTLVLSLGVICGQTCKGCMES